MIFYEMLNIDVNTTYIPKLSLREVSYKLSREVF